MENHSADEKEDRDNHQAGKGFKVSIHSFVKTCGQRVVRGARVMCNFFVVFIVCESGIQEVRVVSSCFQFHTHK